MRILPSATTVLAICAGLTSIKFALDGLPHIAVALIGAAAVLDGIDGGIARALDAQLARFNALLDDDTRPAYTRQYFTGMPAPCGAVGVIGPLVAMLQFGHGWWTSPWFVCVWFAANAALLVSRVPTLALKSVSMPPNAAPVLLILIAAAAAGLLLFPYILVLLIIAGYVCIIPFTVRSQRWVAARPESWNDKPGQRRATRRAIRQSAPNRRSVARLGLRKPGR